VLRRNKLFSQTGENGKHGLVFAASKMIFTALFFAVSFNFSSISLSLLSKMVGMLSPKSRTAAISWLKSVALEKKKKRNVW